MPILGARSWPATMRLHHGLFDYWHGIDSKATEKKRGIAKMKTIRETVDVLVAGGGTAG